MEGNFLAGICKSNYILPALILTIANFLDTQVTPTNVATALYKNLLENKILEKDVYQEYHLLP